MIPNPTRPGDQDKRCLRSLQSNFVTAFLLWLASTGIAHCEAAPTSRPATAQDTYVGFYFSDLSQLDLKKSTYTADFYVWLRWRGDNDPSNIEFLNGSLNIKEHPNTISAGGSKYVSFHCRGTFHDAFEPQRRPRDRPLSLA